MSCRSSQQPNKVISRIDCAKLETKTYWMGSSPETGLGGTTTMCKLNHYSYNK